MGHQVKVKYHNNNKNVLIELLVFFMLITQVSWPKSKA